MGDVQTDIVQLTSAEMTIEYSMTAGDILLASLLAFLIAVIVAKWFYDAIFNRKKG